jgi:hypothetical protein
MPIEGSGKIGELTNDAESSLTVLLNLKELKLERHYMRLSVDGISMGWEPLASDLAENDGRIKERIALSEKPVTDLVLAFVGVVNWRSKKQLMARMQYFRIGYTSGLVFGSHLRTSLFGPNPQRQGGFLIFGACQNLWI